MSGMTTGNSDALIRAKVWSAQLKDVLTAELTAQGYVDWMPDFPDGNSFSIPSIGGPIPAQDYQEDEAINYQALDTGEWLFNINNYVANGTYITRKNQQDGFYMSQLEGSFVPKMARGIAERIETDIFKEGQPKTGNPAGYQVAGNGNKINGADHRRVGQATVNTKQTLDIKDFAYAKYALRKALVPQENLIAIVDPSVEYILGTMTNLANVSTNPMWEGIITSGLGNGKRFIRNIYGFDVYVSDYLPVCGQAQSGTSETINAVASGANAVANLFFSASADVKPFKGAWRQDVHVDSDFNKDFQREEYVTTARYGLKIFRPENLVTILCDPTAV